MKKLTTILFILIGFNVSAQFNLTLKKLTVDSVNARTNYIWLNDTAQVVEDILIRDTSIVDLIKYYGAEGVVSLGNVGQMPFMNSGGTDFDYGDVKYNGTEFLIGDYYTTRYNYLKYDSSEINWAHWTDNDDFWNFQIDTSFFEISSGNINGYGSLISGNANLLTLVLEHTGGTSAFNLDDNGVYVENYNSGSWTDDYLITKGYADANYLESLSGTTNGIVISDGIGGIDTYESFKWNEGAESLNIGVNKWTLSSSSFRGFSGASRVPAIVYQTAQRTIPNILIDGNDTDTGLGSGASDEISVIAGGYEAIRITPDTVFVNNNLKVDSNLYVNGFIDFNGSVVTSAMASAYIEDGDQASTTISAADTYYFLKGAFTNVKSIDFMLSGDTLMYSGSSDVSLTLNYTCTFSVGQVNTTVTTAISINDIINSQSINDRKISATSDKGAWGGLATVSLKYGDKIKLVVSSDKTGTVTAERFSTILK